MEMVLKMYRPKNIFLLADLSFMGVPDLIWQLDFQDSLSKASHV